MKFPLHVGDALFTFTPDKIILDELKAEFGKSNLMLSGHVYNYNSILVEKRCTDQG